MYEEEDIEKELVKSVQKLENKLTYYQFGLVLFFAIIAVWAFIFGSLQEENLILNRISEIFLEAFAMAVLSFFTLYIIFKGIQILVISLKKDEK